MCYRTENTLLVNESKCVIGLKIHCLSMFRPGNITSWGSEGVKNKCLQTRRGGGGGLGGGERRKRKKKQEK